MSTKLPRRHVDLLARIHRQRGCTIVSALRREHGPFFLPAFNGTDDLADVILILNETSLGDLERRYPA